VFELNYNRVMAFTHPEYLVSADWLEAHLDDPLVRVLDVTAKLTSKLQNRAKEECFDLGHLPGSVFFDVASGKGVLSDQGAELPWMWPDAEEFTASMVAAGVGPQTRVVLVARTPRAGIDAGTMWCTRAWWTMHHYGIECSILHGGIEGWEAEQRPMTTDVTVVPVSGPPSLATDWAQARATKDDVLTAIESSTCLIDALPESSFDGTGTGYGPRGGHISGAINVPYMSLVDRETAGFLDADAMEQQLTEVGLVGPSATEPVITYCGGAIAATVDAFALALFGRTDVSVYDGSLMEWTADASLPMTNPAKSGAGS
jgi:thiosulfate/3-mercaptopyruvate sulfurtransferase